MLRSALIAMAIASPVQADPPNCGLYTYQAEIVRVIDGDTVVADIDLGFHTWRRGERLRLSGVFAPEPREPGGEAASAALRARVEGREVYICTEPMKRSSAEARGSFGRYLVTIYDAAGNVNDWLVEEGLATGQ